jgi:hypothetical protein
MELDNKDANNRLSLIILNAGSISGPGWMVAVAAQHPNLVDALRRVGHQMFNDAFITWPILKHKLTVQQAKNLEELLTESVYTGFATYRGIRDLDTKGSWDFPEGDVPPKVLEDAYSDYFVNKSKNSDDILSQEAFQANKLVCMHQLGKLDVGGHVNAAGEDYMRYTVFQPMVAAGAGYVLAAVYEAALKTQSGSSESE